MSKYDKYLVPSSDPVLKQVCREVLPGENISDICERMMLVCKKGSRKGVGLAAPQIGHAIRLVFINCAVNGILREFMVNPVIIDRAHSMVVEEEGCLSYPGKSKAIARPDWIDVRYFTLNRMMRTVAAYGYHARVICHEVDHLDGICRVGDDSPADEVSESILERSGR